MKIFTVLVFFAAFFVEKSTQQSSNKTPEIKKNITDTLALTPSVLVVFQDALKYVGLKNSDSNFLSCSESRFAQFMDSIEFVAAAWNDHKETAPLSPDLKKFASQLGKLCRELSAFGVNKAYTLLYYFYVTYSRFVKRYSTEFQSYGTGDALLNFTIMDASRVKTTNVSGNKTVVYQLQKESEATSKALENLLYDNPGLSSDYFYYMHLFVMSQIGGLISLCIPRAEEALKTNVTNGMNMAVKQLNHLNLAFTNSMAEPRFLYRYLAEENKPGECADWVMFRNL